MFTRRALRSVAHGRSITAKMQGNEEKYNILFIFKVDITFFISIVHQMHNLTVAMVTNKDNTTTKRYKLAQAAPGFQ